MDSTPENSVVMYLVSRGASLNARDTYGCTPLHFAAMRGNELVTYELLQCKGINIEVSALVQHYSVKCQLNYITYELLQCKGINIEDSALVHYSVKCQLNYYIRAATMQRHQHRG